MRGGRCCCAKKGRDAPGGCFLGRPRVGPREGNVGFVEALPGSLDAAVALLELLLELVLLRDELVVRALPMLVGGVAFQLVAGLVSGHAPGHLLELFFLVGHLPVQVGDG